MIKAKIYITLKAGIVDPQGRAIQQALVTLGFSTVNDVRVGKFLEIEVNEESPVEAETRLKAMCEQLLANTVIEDYRYELETPSVVTPS